MSSDGEWQTVPQKLHHRSGPNGSGPHRRNRGGRNSGNRGQWRGNISGDGRDARSRSRSKSATRPAANHTAPATTIVTGGSDTKPELIATQNKFELPGGLVDNGGSERDGEAQLVEGVEGMMIQGAEGGRTVSFRPVDPTKDVHEQRYQDDDDDDDDDSAYGEGEEDEGEESISFPAVPINIRCPFEHTKENEEEDKGPWFASASELIKHLREAHQLVFRSLSHTVLYLQAYLDAWAHIFTENGRDAYGVEEPHGAGSMVLRVIDPLTTELDYTVRETERKKALDEVLRRQDKQRRGEATEPTPCLFCTYRCRDRADQFRHMFKEHNFNIGLPDNLVDVNEFLDILRGKLNNLQCLYCEKTFTSATVLRKHMRKKKHFKISPHNHLYDRFYVINYIETGKSWEEIESEKYDSDQDKQDNSWEDWKEEEGDVMAETKSLFDEKRFRTAEECVNYMRDEYGFNLPKVEADLEMGFYGIVALINYIRKHVKESRCFGCKGQFEGAEELSAHFKQTKASCLVDGVSEAKDEELKDLQYLTPVIESDPLLMMMVDDEGSDANKEAEETQRIVSENMKRLREMAEPTIPVGVVSALGRK